MDYQNSKEPEKVSVMPWVFICLCVFILVGGAVGVLNSCSGKFSADVGLLPNLENTLLKEERAS